MTWPFRS
ncbi:hypothetical protein EC960939_0718, partial [Escherichia coli 96.0939]